MVISLIVAADENNVIGGGNKLLWYLPEDMKHFRKLTLGHTMIMGRKTFESIGHPLPGRRNIVVSRKAQSIPGAETVGSLDEAFKKAEADKSAEVFVIGGGQIYSQALSEAERIYITRVHSEFAGDIFFPGISEKEWIEISREEHGMDEKNKFGFTFLIYEKRHS
ncbi:dihydrofolate reductase [Candidatus Peribacteria bacterium RIFCSPLOWO2_01_FULL_51_18]|nr:MAG: dihydrofolate reductase [Candidatus Peribacteria bacterium RIFCSPHIGHO2_02_FULL_51_15]OGJ65134.1 MAG: dihydrofolate reductase [Candidatus Peribacteria bacterium RIFCSPLOWO2_01_FULL_51_18]OGJ68476.1 MAG: dihydrofolate reductase [Candidatus Peribacteria bacterium RIFCSPLOWO2_02_FULL_51_10]